MRQEQSNKLLLIDGHSILNRAFYGLPDMTNSAGLHTNAIYGFLNIMFHIIDLEQPTHLTVAFDEHAPTFRHEMYAEYKGTRKPMADELRQQVPVMKDLLTAMDIPVISQPGLEADDLLGTMARIAENVGFEVTIVSGDRDLLQLATDHIKISIPKTKKTGTEIEEYYAADVEERYLVTPTEFIDVKALMGDTSDNIPGVPGIGEKTATAIIAQYHSIEEAHAHADALKPPRAAKNIVEFYEQAQMSKVLATIETHADISYDLDAAILGDLYTEQAYTMCKDLEFKNFLTRFDVHTKEPEIAVTRSICRDEKTTGKFFAQMLKDKPTYIGAFLAYTTEPVEPVGQLSLFDEPTAADGLLGLAFSYDNVAAWMPVSEGLSASFLRERLQEIYAQGLCITVRDLKSWIKFFTPDATTRFINYHNSFDVAVADYLLRPLSKTYEVEDLAAEYLQTQVKSYAEYFKKQSVTEAMQSQPEDFAEFAMTESYVCATSTPRILKRLDAEQMRALYDDVELPLVFTLADMELEGMAMDGDGLAVLSEKFATRLSELEAQIYVQAGEEFNINSPKQLGVILFEKLQLPGGKKTKTGYSTSAEVLEALASEAPIVADILEYRQLAKLKSTYADGLRPFLSDDGRVHSTFHQTVTATGRISSSDPNLQNIPTRIELGKEIRRVFHPRESYVYVDADYSQIELRVLAHMSGDANLISAFAQGQDIHRSTASLVFHTPFDEVTDLQRRNAKAVNFGIVYGISAFGLAKDLNIDRKEAAQYIEDYFIAYPQMKEYLDSLVEEGKADGRVKTLYGRIRPIPELSSSNFMQRQFGERVAMNSPIQGTAADIIKIAMVRVHDALLEKGLHSRLVLQVHDELLIETREDELEEVCTLLRDEMEHAADLSVDLDVDLHTGSNWYEAK